MSSKEGTYQTVSSLYVFFIYVQLFQRENEYPGNESSYIIVDTLANYFSAFPLIILNTFNMKGWIPGQGTIWTEKKSGSFLLPGFHVWMNFFAAD